MIKEGWMILWILESLAAPRWDIRISMAETICSRNGWRTTDSGSRSALDTHGKSSHITTETSSGTWIECFRSVETTL